MVWKLAHKREIVKRSSAWKRVWKSYEKRVKKMSCKSVVFYWSFWERFRDIFSTHFPRKFSNKLKYVKNKSKSFWTFWTFWDIFFTHCILDIFFTHAFWTFFSRMHFGHFFHALHPPIHPLLHPPPRKGWKEGIRGAGGDTRAYIRSHVMQKHSMNESFLFLISSARLIMGIKNK